MFINFGDIITKKDIDLGESEGLRHQAFNNELRRQLEELVFDVSKNDKEKQKDLLALKPSLFARIILFIPALIGWIIHAPLYLPVRSLTWKRTWNNDHFDSVMTGILLLVYPVYLVALTLIVLSITKSWLGLLLLLALPFTAWSYVQLKPQLDR